MSALYWGTMEMYAESIDMPPAEKIMLEESLIPAPKQSSVSGEIKSFLINDTLQLNYYPVLFNSEQVEPLSGTAYTRNTDYTVDWVTGVVTRLAAGAIGVEETVSIAYTYVNNEPSTTISSYGRKRRKITIEGWANYTDWASIEMDYSQNVARNVTLPTGTIINMYISRISKTTRKRGLDRVFYALEFMEA